MPGARPHGLFIHFGAQSLSLHSLQYKRRPYSTRCAKRHLHRSVRLILSCCYYSRYLQRPYLLRKLLLNHYVSKENHKEKIFRIFLSYLTFLCKYKSGFHFFTMCFLNISHIFKILIIIGFFFFYFGIIF